MYRRGMLSGPGLYPTAEWMATVKDLDFFPESILKFSYLEYLNLEQNLISEFPNAISKLTKIKELNFSYNLLHTLPEEICELTYLEQLNVSNNFIERLPEKIWTLKNLHNLNLERNNLRTLPAGLLKGQKYDHFFLNLSKNRILGKSALTPELSTYLEQLANNEEFSETEWDKGELMIEFDCGFFIISNQKIIEHLSTEEQEAIIDINQLGCCDLPQIFDSEYETITIGENYIKSIYLQDCYVGHIPESICQLPLLEELYLIDCAIKEFPKSFLWENLHKLVLRHNLIEKLPAEIQNLKNLRELDLSENHLSYLPYESLKIMTKLEFLKLSHQEANLHKDDIIFLERLPGELKNLKEYDLEFNHQVIMEDKHRYSIQRHKRTQGDYIVLTSNLDKLFGFFKKRGINCLLDNTDSDYTYLRIVQENKIDFKKIYTLIKELSRK